MDLEGIITTFGVALAASDERPIGEFLIAQEGYEAYLADKGFVGMRW